MFEKHSSQAPLEMFETKTNNLLTRKAIECKSARTLSLEPFIEAYGLAAIKEDYGRIAEKMAGYMDHKLSPSERLGFIFESAFLDVGKQGWFGENSELVHASMFDDIENKIDTVATIRRPDSSARHIAIASDLAFGFERASAKFNHIIQDVHTGKLAQMKYFHSDLLGFTGRLKNIPKTVVGLDKENLNSFLLNWLREPELAQLQFGAHMITQIHEQSKGLAALAKRKHGGGSLVTDAYERTAQVTNEILLETYNGIEPPSDNITKAITDHSKRLRTGD